MKQNMKQVLDVCCGSRMFYFNKNDSRVSFNDIRQVDVKLCDGRRLLVQPDTKYDFRKLPYKDKSFKLVVFDPPHLVKAGNKSWLAQKYGVLPEDWGKYIKEGFDECWRCLDNGGILLMKWSCNQIEAKKVLQAIEHTPLLGDKRGSKRWFIFYKEIVTSEDVGER